jgi:hypothetical protein
MVTPSMDVTQVTTVIRIKIVLQVAQLKTRKPDVMKDITATQTTLVQLDVLLLYQLMGATNSIVIQIMSVPVIVTTQKIAQTVSTVNQTCKCASILVTLMLTHHAMALKTRTVTLRSNVLRTVQRV